MAARKKPAKVITPANVNECVAAVIARLPLVVSGVRWREAAPGQVGMTITVGEFKNVSAMLPVGASSEQIAEVVARVEAQIGQMGKKVPRLA